jgi:hypothetical protein
VTDAFTFNVILAFVATLIAFVSLSRQSAASAVTAAGGESCFRLLGPRPEPFEAAHRKGRG